MNRSIQVLCGLFTYPSLTTMPWRLSNLLHLMRTRCGMGLDFYGSSTEEVWFSVPLKTRIFVTIMLILNSGAQWVNQWARIRYPDYESSNSYPVRSSEERMTGGAKRRPCTTTVQYLTTSHSSLRPSQGNFLCNIFCAASFLFGGIGGACQFRAEEKVRRERREETILEKIIGMVKGVKGGKGGGEDKGGTRV